MEELKKAPVTVLLILANILVFTAVEFTGGSEDTMHMLQCGAAYTPAIMQGEYYRIFTSMFLHFGPQHLGNNMLVLFETLPVSQSQMGCLCLEADWSVQLEN